VYVCVGLCGSGESRARQRNLEESTAKRRAGEGEDCTLATKDTTALSLPKTPLDINKGTFASCVRVLVSRYSSCVCVLVCR